MSTLHLLPRTALIVECPQFITIARHNIWKSLESGLKHTGECFQLNQLIYYSKLGFCQSWKTELVMMGRFVRNQSLSSNHVLPTIFCVLHTDVSEAETWSFETNHGSTRSYFLDGNKDVKASHPTFSFFRGKPTTVFSRPFGYGSIVC